MSSGVISVFIGRLPEMKITEPYSPTPLLIVIKLEEFDYKGAAALGTVMLVISFTMLLAINLLQAWGRRRYVRTTR